MKITVGKPLEQQEKSVLAQILALNNRSLYKSCEYKVSMSRHTSNSAETIDVQLSAPLYKRASANSAHPDRIYYDHFNSTPIATGNKGVTLNERICTYRAISQNELFTKTDNEDPDKQAYLGKQIVMSADEDPEVVQQTYDDLKYDMSVFRYFYQPDRTHDKNIIMIVNSKYIKLIGLIPRLPGVDLVVYLKNLHRLVMQNSLLPNPNYYLGVGKIMVIAINGANEINGFHQGHRDRLVHRNIKLNHLLIRDDLTMSLINFDCTATTADAARSNVIYGLDGYIAPEALDNSFPVTQKSDAYSYGILLECFYNLVFNPDEPQNGTLSNLHTRVISDLRSSFAISYLDSLFTELNQQNFFSSFIPRLFSFKDHLLEITPSDRWSLREFSTYMQDLGHSLLRNGYARYLNEFLQNFQNYIPCGEKQLHAKQKFINLIEQYIQFWDNYIDNAAFDYNILVFMDRHLHQMILDLHAARPIPDKTPSKPKKEFGNDNLGHLNKKEKEKEQQHPRKAILPGIFAPELRRHAQDAHMDSHAVAQHKISENRPLSPQKANSKNKMPGKQFAKSVPSNKALFFTDDQENNSENIPAQKKRAVLSN